MSILHDSRPQLERAAVVLAFLVGVAPVVSIAAANILLGASLAVLLVMRARWRMPPVWLPLGLYILGTVIALLLSPDPAGGLPQIRKFYVLLILPVLFTALHGRQLAKRFLVAWGGVGLAAGVLSFGQFGMKFLAARRAGEPFYNYYVGERTTGFMSHWMTFGGLQMMVLLLLAAFVLWPAAGRKWRWAAAVACGLIGVSILLGMTRGVWVASFVAGLYLVWCWNKKWLLLVPVLAVVVVLASPSSVRERLVSIVKPQGYLDSNQHRIVCLLTGLEMIKAHPWFGLGPERVGPEFNQYVPADIPRPLPTGWYGHLHNIYLQYAAERGIPTMLAMMWFLGKILLDFWRGARRAARARSDSLWFLHGAVAVVIAILVEGMVEYNLGDSEVLMLFLTIVCCGYLSLEVLATRRPELDARAASSPEDGEAG